MFSLSRIAPCFVLAIGWTITACGSVIGIGDPALDTHEGGTLPAEASTASDSGSSGSSVDSATPPDAGQLPCGTATCPLATTVCCAYHQTQGSNSTTFECSATCRAPDAVADQVATLKCMQAADCGGRRCCLSPDGTAQRTSECKTSCSGGELTLCAPSANQCGDGFVCEGVPQDLPSTYRYCKPD